MSDNTDNSRPENSEKSNVVLLHIARGPTGPAGPDLPRAVEGETGDLPGGYFLREEGVYQLRASKEGEETPVRLCSWITVIGLCSRKDGTQWGRVVDVRDPDGNVHRVVIDETEFSGSPAHLLRPFLDKGLVIESVDKAMQSIALLLQAWRPKNRFTRADQLGWTDDNLEAFALGDGRVIGDAQIVFQHQANDISRAMHARGSLEDWQQAVAAPCVGNPLMILAVSVAFSGPLLKLLAMDGGGFHLRGSSSKGKSTLQWVAASVWGAPSFVQSWRGTDNGMEGVASACSSTLLILNELQEISPRIAGETVYMLANGCGKLRMQSNGRARLTGRWHVPLLSSGELSLADHLASGGKQIKAGQEVRLIDISADTRPKGAFDFLHSAKDGSEFADQLRISAEASYGTAGPVFVEKLMRNLDRRDVLRDFVAGFCEDAQKKFDLPNDGQVQRALRRFAVTALAGEMATKFLVTRWAPGIARKAALEVFHTWFLERDSATRSDIDVAVSRTRDYFLKNGASFVAIGSPGKAYAVVPAH